MKSLFVPSAIAALAIVAAALQDDANLEYKSLHHRAPRPQASGSTSSATPVTLPPPSSANTGAPSTSVSPPLTSTPPPQSTSYSFSLASTNPTAVPLSLITASQSSFPTLPLASTATVGAIPTFISGAPALPNPATISPANYPALDKPPPTDSALVQQWKEEVANSGVSIPDHAPTNPGGCLNNTAIASDPNRCWWTCTGCQDNKDITQCPDPLSWGLTYDDGPGYYTSNLLQYLDEKALKSTFFVVGSRAISFPATLQAQYMGQHQIAVHTWSHPPLTTLSNDEIIAELGWTKKVIKDVLGVTPNMMRPPFGDIDDGLNAYFNIHNGVTPVQKVLQNWQNILGSASTLDHGFIVLEHDLFQESVEVATGYILPDALAHNPPFKIQPVVSCLGRSLGDGYIETNNNKTNPPPNVSAGGGAGGVPAAGDGDATKSSAGRQNPLNFMVVSTLIVGVSGFAFGLLAMLRV
ncbi:hypothetical protein D9611_006763 [Ephemerocybe angulata]|uniref:chitin deacetylase n=1 Tax=Ephemerocybe angulata TaxID=980116 RepID=A0A8H5EVQ6_9AGAR|nr:hypothetical protein D9611_006763 [Tulosesus angulatus]